MKQQDIRKFKIHPHICYLFRIYLTGLVVFTLFRVIILINSTARLNASQRAKIGEVLQAFWIGFRFDTVVSGYLLIFPFLLLSLFAFLALKKKPAFRLVNIYILVSYAFAFAIGSLDIPYFEHFFSRFSSAALNWADEVGFVWGMVFGDFQYWIYTIMYATITILFILLVARYFKKYMQRYVAAENVSRLGLGITTVVCILALFIAMRGRTTIKSPIRIGTAYFSNNPLLNQLGLNPVFTFVRSWLDSRNQSKNKIGLINSEEALKNVRKYLGIATIPYDFSPLARGIRPKAEPIKANVVLIIMESMAFDKTGLNNPKNSLTPFLDEISKNSYTFTNVYTCGTHTYNGIYATLFGFPTFHEINPLKSVAMLKYHGLATVLKQQGYKTAYFTTHDDQFDNVGGFLKANDFEKIYSEKDYPSKKVHGTLGISDDYLFEFSLPALNKLHEKKQPFLAVFLTASDHRPYVIPEQIPFTPRSREISSQIVEYADWSIKKFLDLAAKEEWFENTIFTFIADHGCYFNSPYDMPLSFFHTPFIIYAPAIITQPKTFSKIGSQMDVFPTLMGVLNIPYTNNTLGIDLVSESRPFTVFTADDKIGCLDHEFFLVIRKNRIESLYKYTTRDTTNYLQKYPDLVAWMKEYSFSMFQTTEWMIKYNLVGR